MHDLIMSAKLFEALVEAVREQLADRLAPRHGRPADRNRRIFYLAEVYVQGDDKDEVLLVTHSDDRQQKKCTFALAIPVRQQEVRVVLDHRWP